MYFKKVIAAIGYTPLVEPAQKSPNSKARILAKLEGQNPGGGNATGGDRILNWHIRIKKEIMPPAQPPR